MSDTDQITNSAFNEDHNSALLAFQSGEERFVWGRDKNTGDLWHLHENTATEWRIFVNERIVCPVPGCGAKLTTVNRTKKRDGFQHFASGGGHSPESIFHSQGCALIENWLRANYPRSKAQREEYTNEAGERRADVLLTGPNGNRIAFEIQYSSITPDAWQRRHDSYRNQGIVDVWLFGHTPNHLKFHGAGNIRPNSTHKAVVRSGQALMFLNPSVEAIGVAVGVGRLFDSNVDRYLDEPIPVYDDLSTAKLEIHSLSEFSASKRYGLCCKLLEGLYTTTGDLRARNKTALADAAQSKKEKQRSWEAIRRPQQDRIRALFSTVQRWSKSDALAEIRAYINQCPQEPKRFDHIIDPKAPPGLLVQWQCVIYFHLIAGATKSFGARDAYQQIDRRGLRMETDGFTRVVKYLHLLEENGFLSKTRMGGQHPSFEPTTIGAWL